MPFVMQRAGVEKMPSIRHMERYPMSGSDLISSNSSSENDIKDLIFRNYRSNQSIERFGQMPSILDEFQPRSSDNNRPHSLISTKCSRIRTNPKYRYSYSNCHSKICEPRRFSTSDGHYENSDNSSESQCSPVQRYAQRNRRRYRLRNQLR